MAAKAQTKTFSFGGCKIDCIGPAVSTLSSKTPALNVSVTFEEALKLSLAIDECVRQLNRYKRNTSIGKNKGVNLMIRLQAQSITVNETDL